MGDFWVDLENKVKSEYKALDLQNIVQIILAV